jgi:tetratricopeptide (TPR) repeat protein
LNQDYFVELDDSSHTGPPHRVLLDPQNTFEFRGVAPGVYTIRIVRAHDRSAIHEEAVNLSSANSTVLLRLRDEERQRPVSGTVSAERLRNPMPAKVLKGMMEAQRLSESGSFEAAAEKLRDLVRRHPGIWEAHLNLGVQDLRLGYVEKALRSFLRARELQPRSALAAINAAAALATLDRLIEAQSMAREALALDPGNRAARTLLDRIERARALRSAGLFTLLP